MPTRAWLVIAIVLVVAFAATAVIAWFVLRQPPLAPVAVPSTSVA